MVAAIYKRVLLKLSGEALAGPVGYGINMEVVKGFAAQIKDVIELDVEMAVVVGGGNFWRGAAAAGEKGMDRTTADHIGMLATVMNALALGEALRSVSVEARVLSAIDMKQVAEFYTRRDAASYLQMGRVVVFAGGTGNPYFSTDTAAALRAAEIGAEALLMAKGKVDAVYDMDPLTHPQAVKFTELDYIDIIQRNLGVMDSTAAALCRDNKIDLIVFGLHEAGNIKRVVMGEKIGTTIKSRE